MTTLNLGNIQVDSPKIEDIIKTKSLEEIKSLFITFLEKNLTTTSPKDKQSKWSELADKIENSMSKEASQQILNSSQEFRNDFEFRGATIDG